MLFDRYDKIRVGADYANIPYINIPNYSSDRYVIYKKTESRFDKLSQEFYGDPTYAWIIYQANPLLDVNDIDYPDKIQIRIPYPLDKVIADYEQALTTHFKKNT